jgi:glucose-6-phosphate isomerase
MIKGLEQFCGLGIELDIQEVKLNFDKAINFSSPAVRTLEQMKEVLKDKGITEPQELYYMYRDVHRISDKPLLHKNNLRYDVTVIKPDHLASELMKTAGHYHPGSFGELYEVVNGRGFCLLQRRNVSDDRIIEEVILVEAKAGQKIVIPPGFGHILVNPGPEILVTSNWVSSKFSSEYQLYKKAGGAAFFLVADKGKLEFIRNPYFTKLPDIKFKKPTSQISKFGLREDRPIYPIINTEAKKLDFLNRPLDFDYADIFTSSKGTVLLASS